MYFLYLALFLLYFTQFLCAGVKHITCSWLVVSFLNTPHHTHSCNTKIHSRKSFRKNLYSIRNCLAPWPHLRTCKLEWGYSISWNVSTQQQVKEQDQLVHFMKIMLSECHCFIVAFHTHSGSRLYEMLFWFCSFELQQFPIIRKKAY